MSRFPRPVFANIPLHIVQRGNNRNQCFFCPADYRMYLSMLADALIEFECSVHAYALMPNHVHLLATPHDIRAPALLMKRVGQRYVQYVNRRYARFGTLWQGRYHSSLVDTERYFMACQRYVELNPVRASIVADPADYAWSSYRFHAYGIKNEIVVPHDVYTSISSNQEERESCYRALFASALPSTMLDEIRQATKGNGICGSEHFTEKMAAALGRGFLRQAKESKYSQE